jgi:hypothetical protein
MVWLFEPGNRDLHSKIAACAVKMGEQIRTADHDTCVTVNEITSRHLQGAISHSSREKTGQ